MVWDLRLMIRKLQPNASKDGKNGMSQRITSNGAEDLKEFREMAQQIMILYQKA
jgi:hypothetical protein